jgi:hypothetical protein
MRARASVSFNLTAAARTFSSTFSAVERAGMSDLQEGQKISFELEDDRKSGKKSAGKRFASSHRMNKEFGMGFGKGALLGRLGIPLR